MKRILLTLMLAVLSVTFVATDVEAKRLGGGSSSGMRRSTPPARPAQPEPGKPAATPGNPAQGAPATPAAAPKRSWMGPLAGIAAGLGIAALMSHFGMGAEMGNILTMVLLGVGALMLVRFLMRRFAPAAGNPLQPQDMQYAGAHMSGMGVPQDRSPQSFGGGAANLSAAPIAAAGTLPANFDTAAFERVAKLIFIRMQAANDAGNLDDLRQFATPEMFATFKLDLQDRKSAPQQTDVVQLDAQVLDFAEEGGNQIVSVRFHGLIREENDGPANPFDETWHLVKPADGSREWAIAGIAQN